ncbi:MAG: permease prefix domain 1-containing protein [Ilumatobacteraceae bacterium]
MTDSPIDRYLDHLFARLRHSPPADARSMLDEADAHLHDTAARLLAEGMNPLEAEHAAVERFGAADLIAGDELRRSTGLARQVTLTVWALGAIGAIAVGVSGVLAGAMRIVGASQQFLAPGATDNLSATDCLRWLALDPRAGSCAQAAVADWATETVVYRMAIGILGVAAYACLRVARRRSTMRDMLPRIVPDTVALVAFGAGGCWCAAMTVDALAAGAHGAGAWLSAAIVALPIAAAAAVRLSHDLRLTTLG